MWATERREIGLAALTCFCGLLRVGELLKLKTRDVLLGPLNDPAVILLLGTTKRGRDERVVMVNALLHRAFGIVLKQRGRNDSAFGLTYFTFRTWFLRAFRALGLPSEGLRSHGLRRGGPTELANRGCPMLNIVEYDRWASENSARDYIRRGQSSALRVRAQMDNARWRYVTVLAEGVHSVLDTF